VTSRLARDVEECDSRGSLTSNETNYVRLPDRGKLLRTGRNRDCLAGGLAAYWEEWIEDGEDRVCTPTRSGLTARKATELARGMLSLLWRLAD